MRQRLKAEEEEENLRPKAEEEGQVDEQARLKTSLLRVQETQKFQDVPLPSLQHHLGDVLIHW